jgi:hypothetical protein
MKAITLILEHDFGDIVYLKADEERLSRIVVGVEFGPSLTVRYRLQTSNYTPTEHYAFEIVKEKSELKLF